MPVPRIPQPEILIVDQDLRLRKFDGCYDFAFSWYQDAEMVYQVDGVRRPYSRETLDNMYQYLDVSTGSCISSKSGRMAFSAPSEM